MIDASRIRRSVATLVLTAGLVFVVFGVGATYTNHIVFDRRSFAERVVRSIREPAVARLLADRISRAVVQANRDLTAYRPMIYLGAREIVSSPTFSSVTRAGAETLHFIAFSEGGKDLLLNLADAGVLLKNALPVLPPQIAERIPDNVIVNLGNEVAIRRLDTTLDRLRDIASYSRYAEWLLAGGALLVLVAAAVSPTPWRAGRETGWLLVLVALMLALAPPVGAALIDGAIPDGAVAAAAAGAWRSFLYDVRDWMLMIGGIGVTLLSPTLAVERNARAAKAWLTTVPATLRERLLRAAVLIIAGYLIVRWPAELIRLSVFWIGVALLALGVKAVATQVFRLEQHGPVWTGALRPAVIAGATALTLVGLSMWRLSSFRPVAPPAVALDTCNGSKALCRRTLDTVVFPTTHNAMASADQPTWFFPAQEAGIAAQLRDGIRGFQIDAHYGYPVDNSILTVLHDEGEARRTYERVLGEEGVDAALRIRNRLLGSPRGEMGMYLCHGFCELGAIELVSAFRTMRTFLRDRPREVLIIVIQDEDVLPADIARAADESGLSEVIYRGPVTGPWPTLEDMIEARQQVLVVAERHAGEVPWYHPAFEVFQETPFDFRSMAAFSCQPWRGGTHGSLFQLNHWITRVPSPRPSDARVVNAYDFLMRRVRTCMSERGMIPNLIAVDFYRTGDLFRVVDELNHEAAFEEPPAGALDALR